MCFKVCDDFNNKPCFGVRLQHASGYGGYFIMKAWMQNFRAFKGKLIKLRIFRLIKSHYVQEHKDYAF